MGVCRVIMRATVIAFLVSIPIPPPAEAGNLLYLNRCANGCKVDPSGYDDDRQSPPKSTIPQQPSILPAWPWGDDAWHQLVQCVGTTYAPFDLLITEDDPGGVPHFEVMLGGRSTDVQVDSAGGIAPGIGCDAPMQNALSFVFAAETSDVSALCWAAAQETGHLFGLDHELDAMDPMTYLGPSQKAGFQDVNADCGESTPRACTCGGRTQNSYAHLMHALGAAKPLPEYSDLGTPCTGTFDCKSEMCASDGTSQVCTQPCDLMGACPDGYQCVPANLGNVCWPAAPADSGGCATGKNPPAFASLLLLIRRRRDRRSIARVP